MRLAVSPSRRRSSAMEFAVFMTLPGLVILLTVVAFADQPLLRAGRAGLLPWRNSVRHGQIPATGFEQDSPGGADGGGGCALRRPSARSRPFAPGQ
jgi:hypothetical protein